MGTHGWYITLVTDLDVDAVVVGTGAGGGMALRELARAGLSVVALEQGPDVGPRDFDQREDKMIPLLFQQGGGRTTADLAIRVLGGRGVGGSTIHNTNLCKRTPDEVLDLWARKYGVENAGPKEMAASFETVETDLSVTRIPDDDVNANNDVLRRGVLALGWKGGVLAHNRVGCVKSGFCELGCAYDAKQNAAKVLVPQAKAAGATVRASVDVRRVTFANGAITGVEAVAADGSPIVVRARVVVLAGSAIGSAAVAKRSGLPDPHGVLGTGLRMHPGAVVAGTFADPIDGHHGIPQSYECTEMLSFDEGAEKRTWIVPAFAHPVGTAATLPGFGAAHMKAMRDYRHLAVLTAMLHDESSGEIELDEDGEPRIHYRLIERDRAALARGLVACARLMFAAGAREVTIPSIPPVRLRSAKELDGLDTSFVRPHGVPMSAVHPMGTMRMGKDPRSSVVASTGEHHQVRGLFVLDGSLFPTSIGGPPQISIYAFAHHLSRHAIDRARR
jgi:choline dehydrogenase-like flavoprotein